MNGLGKPTVRRHRDGGPVHGLMSTLSGGARISAQDSLSCMVYDQVDRKGAEALTGDSGEPFGHRLSSIVTKSELCTIR